MALILYFNSVSNLFRSYFSKNGNMNPINAKNLFRISSDPTTPKARFVVKRSETLERPLSKIEHVDENTFRCYVYRFKFFAFEVCLCFVVRVEEQLNGYYIRLLSCSPIVVAQNEKFSASMVNQISCGNAILVEVIESSGEQVLDQIIRLILPRFMDQ
ncbi:hypothetical protein MKX01_040693, partial [Papaver californicum]